MFDDPGDEYDFKPSETSKLASLFGSSGSSANSSKDNLLYIPPKQPRPVSNKPKLAIVKKSQIGLFSVKIMLKEKENPNFVNGAFLIQEIVDQEESKTLEGIIYQNKKTVFLCCPLNQITIASSENNIIECRHNNVALICQFNDPKQYEGFQKICESKNVKIEGLFKEKETNKQSQKSDKITRALEDENSLEILNITAKNDREDNANKDDIMRRIAKIGFSQLPPGNLLPKSDHLTLNKTGNLSSCRESISNPKNELTIKELKETLLEHIPKASKTSQITYHKNDSLESQDIKTILSNISLKLDDIIALQKKNPNNEENINKSKVKALQLKATNLETELHEQQTKYAELEEKHSNLMSKSNTTNSEACTSENKNLQEKYDALHKSYELLLLKNETVEENIALVKEKFVKSMKHSMNEMYVNILKTNDEEKELVFAKEFKSATFNIIQNFTELLDDHIISLPK